MSPLLPALWLALACSGRPEPDLPPPESRLWPEAAAVAPTLARLDQDGDGRVGQPEVERVATGEPGFAQMDADRDGDLSAPELLAWMDRTDPLTFDKEVGLLPVGPDQAPPPPQARQVALLEELLGFLVAEVEAIAAREGAPAPPLPTPYHLQQAASTGTISDPKVQAILRDLRAGYATLGRPFPAALQPLLQLPSPAEP